MEIVVLHYLHPPSPPSLAEPIPLWTSIRPLALIFAPHHILARRRRHLAFMCLVPRVRVSVRALAVGCRRRRVVPQVVRRLPPLLLGVCPLLSVGVDAALGEVVGASAGGDQDAPAIAVARQ